MITDYTPKQELDNDIIPILNKLNNCEYYTAWSCSGTIKDHLDLNGKPKRGFIKFLGDEIENKMIEKIHNCSVHFKFEKTITHNSIDGFLFEVYETDEDMLKTDEERIKKWMDFAKTLCNKKLYNKII